MPWFPQDKYCWDFWFARRGEELHLFYLQASQAECDFNPELRHNLSSIGHAVMTPWGWRELAQPALTKSGGKAWDNLSIWTGCVVEDGEMQHLFYTARHAEDAPVWTPSEWQRKQQIGLATSSDLIHWERTEDSKTAPVIPNPGKMLGLDGVAWRDPWVMRGDDGAWHAFICARLNPADANNKDFGVDAGAVIAWLKSDDLNKWDCSQTRRLVTSDEFYQMEVPQIFWREFEGGKRMYLLFCAQEKDCSRLRRQRIGDECRTGTYYLHSELLPLDYQGIPALKGSARLLAPGWYAGRLLDAETAEAPVFFGFQWADAAGYFVGGVSDPMPVRFKSDGIIEIGELE